MKFATIVGSLLFSGIATAQDIQSKPFNLVIQSKDKTLDGQRFGACHTGAAIESLCLSGRDGSDFYFNTTKGAQTPIKGYVAPGVLVYNLPIDPPVPSSMRFSTNPSTNVAMPLFFPGYEAQYVTFDKKGLMSIIDYLDDTQTPPTASTPKALYNWYVCQSYYSSYTYHTLNWVLGNGSAKPQNPSCVKVDVRRQFK